MSIDKIHNRKQLKALRRALRANMTSAEIYLWKQLQRSQLNGRKFRRQHSIGPYVVDFYCPAERLVIELDGAAHDSSQAWKKDTRRTEFLQAQGLKVLRFENREVMENLEGVLLVIRQYLAS
ncbi:MAG TPA: endonuclease domain-containing protein [Methylococcus sp.]|nr:endonuclease domain-containing protein [Methylococcus sp.]